jgi:hypothetical protein
VYDAGEAVEATLNLSNEIPEDEAGWRAAIQTVTGLALPEHREVVLTQVRYWGPPDDAAKYAYCRFTIRDRDMSTSIDAIQVLHSLRKGKKARKSVASSGVEDATAVLSWNDWQAGKAEGGGTLALAERLDRQFDEFLDRIKDIPARRRPKDLVIAGVGDMVEGCFIFPHQSFQIDGDRRTQIRNTVSLILEGLDRIAPSFERVRVGVVGGNHGQNRVDGKKVNRHDNDDCAVFEHAALAASRDPLLQNVEFYISQEEPALTLEVQGHILGMTHGDVFDRGGGAQVEGKAYKWYSQQAAGHRAAGDANLLLTAHYHHHALADWGACQWVQAPANDGGSGHFTDASGRYADPGMLTWVMTPSERYLDPFILR